MYLQRQPAIEAYPFQDSITAILVQFQKAGIFQIYKRNRTNQKMIDKWGNAKTALPR